MTEDWWWWRGVLELLSAPSGYFYLGVGTGVLVGVVSLLYYLTRQGCPDYGTDYDSQSVVMEDGSYSSHWAAKHGKLMQYYFEDAKTIHESFLRGRGISGDGRCLGARTGPQGQYEWISYNEVYSRMKAFGSGLFQLGLWPGQNTNVGIFAQNRPEWVIADQSCHMFSMVTVGIFDTLGSGAQAVFYVIKLCEIAAVVCDTAARAQMLIEGKRQIRSLRIVIMMEEVTKELHHAARLEGIKLIRFSEVENIGKKNLHEPLPPKPSDVATICFTSGTTGDPKGTVLTHENVVADVAGITERVTDDMLMRRTDIHLSYLPLAHMYERCMMLNVLTHGACAGFYSRDIRLLFDDLQTLKPTYFNTVPRLLNKIRDKMLVSMEGNKVKSFLFQIALNMKMREVKRGILRKDSVWDRMALRDVAAMLGSDIRYVFTASAPLSRDVFDFIRAVLGCPMFEGYGQTETTAGMTVTSPGEASPDHVGSPLACNYVKLIDIPDMGYFVKDGIGEVCAKGTNVMKGYYRNPEKTREVFTPDGWVRTGDVGVFNKNGTLQVVDRCKHIFKLSQGEYIAPERIEVVYIRSKYVHQCFVDGDSLKSRCVAVVVPDPDMAVHWAAASHSTQLQDVDIHSLCQQEEFKQTVLNDMLHTGKQAGLKSVEQVIDIALQAEAFSVEAGLITPTFKNKRPELRKQLAHKIADIYSRHPKET